MAVRVSHDPSRDIRSQPAAIGATNSRESVNAALRLKADPVPLQWAIMANGPKGNLIRRIGHGRRHEGQEF